MSYERLSPRQKQALDLLMAGECSRPNIVAVLKRKLRVSESTVKKMLATAYGKYGIRSDRYIPHVRLVYLRAKELGML